MYSKHNLPRKPFQTYVFMDLEATGLPFSRPRIAELCLIAVSRHALENTEYSNTFRSVPVFPRVVDKLSLCVNPQKPFTPVASTITGLSNDLLNTNSRQCFNIHIIHMLEAFLKRQPAPMCFVAHNGYNYDFPLLKAELNGIGFSVLNDVYCADSLAAMKALDKANNHFYQFAGQQSISGRKTYSLEGLYLKFFKENPADSHTAEGDTIALIAIFQWRAKDLISWMDLNAKQFDEIKTMFKDPLKEQTKLVSPAKALWKIKPTQSHFLPEDRVLTSRTYRFYDENSRSLKNKGLDAEEQYSLPLFNWLTNNHFTVTHFMITVVIVLIVLICISL
ncbi:three-prime repair exonuclease 1 [Microcaecilia unicolor]|uniref:exodeoxyribonuclease III n=1 Tax=Microcaecilia unicolor TaxID=1415580 RepID=A0A6P7YG17_9AMPH|nr:three-prime repair exonuclease 1 [Microcaecilia unicolor]XP_030062045.1 three-prime repair exonuclease 1 [Microcaecilia unicolor]